QLPRAHQQASQSRYLSAVYLAQMRSITTTERLSLSAAYVLHAEHCKAFPDALEVVRPQDACGMSSAAPTSSTCIAATVTPEMPSKPWQRRMGFCGLTRSAELYSGNTCGVMGGSAELLCTATLGGATDRAVGQ